MPSWVGRLIKTDQFESLLYDGNHNPHQAELKPTQTTALSEQQTSRSAYVSALGASANLSLNQITHPTRKI